MNILEAALRQIAADLGRYGRSWALVGGFAVSARAEPRFTRDIDAAVIVDDDSDGEGLVRSLLADRYRVLASVEQEETGRLATVRLASPLSGGDVVVDLLFASSGIEPEIVRAAEVTEIVPGLSLPIATAGHLMALKVLARDDQERPQDLVDLRALRAVATSDDYRVARDAVRLISARGFDRGRDLIAGLKEIEQSPIE
ncbi:MAG TPA: nucleotidyl transferase AbiEii/AbiGii toxin family protein [Streptosporangiaceae bacterium]|nr:nucleotidyl transferase AbiEii/AbiGii toxin family protein [Streptosporangiaceae bacterium]